MSRIWKTIRSYIWWHYERGSFHYDVMVTLILLFIFLGPRYLDFKDKPQERNLAASGVTITQISQDEFSYQVEVGALRPGANLEDELKHWIEPFLGDVKVKEFTPVTDKLGHITAYQVRVQKM